MKLVFVLCLFGLSGEAKRPKAVRLATKIQAPLQLKSGDVLLQSSTSKMAAVIQKVSQSPYNHVGLVEVATDGIFVIEAISPVSRTPLKKFLKRSHHGDVMVRRVSNLTELQARQVLEYAKSNLQKPYDTRFQWDDQRLYCSELVSKAFEQAGLEIGRKERALELNVGFRELVVANLRDIPLSTVLVTPASIAIDEDLVTVATDQKEFFSR
jgi:uncharacterized protein YycO